MNLIRCLFVCVAVTPAAFGGSVVTSFQAPGATVTGLAAGDDLLWVLDPDLEVIFGLEVSGSDYTIVEIIDTQLSEPDNLAYAQGTLYYTQQGSSVIHSVSADGSARDSMDVSSLGLSSISGLGYENHNFGGNACMYVLDDVQEKVFNIYPLDDFSSIEEIADTGLLPQFFDVAGSGENSQVWIACGSEEDNFQLWDSSGELWGFSVPEAPMVTEIAQDEIMYPMEFMWFYDQTYNTILLVYYGMSVEGATWGRIKSTFFF
ncbi:MAG: hypothetical protein KAH54_06735 [Candidatus Sabulitectum sp.]|nr:hypothetical protein [Candidatus Sabulitectum sp.]